jgi:hypothetical protein
MNLKLHYEWKNAGQLTSRSFVCGYCGSPLASQLGYVGRKDHGGGHNSWAHLYICHFCSRPTFFDDSGEQVPGIAFGNDVGDVTDKAVNDLYNEARRATSANCHTAAVLCCRKLLMHIAVAKGAKAGDSFASYVDFLAEKNYVPPDARTWVDHIRQKSNEANHDINIMAAQDSEELLSFLEMLLKIIYEFPATVRKKYPQKTS